MPNTFLNLTLSPAGDSGQNQMTGAGTTATPDQLYSDLETQDSGFSGVFQQAVSSKDDIAQSVVANGAELPPGGKLLPEDLEEPAVLLLGDEGEPSPSVPDDTPQAPDSEPEISFLQVSADTAPPSPVGFSVSGVAGRNSPQASSSLIAESEIQPASTGVMWDRSIGMPQGTPVAVSMPEEGAMRNFEPKASLSRQIPAAVQNVMFEPEPRNGTRTASIEVQTAISITGDNKREKPSALGLSSSLQSQEGMDAVDILPVSAYKHTRASRSQGVPPLPVNGSANLHVQTGEQQEPDRLAGIRTEGVYSTVSKTGASPIPGMSAVATPANRHGGTAANIDRQVADPFQVGGKFSPEVRSAAMPVSGLPQSATENQSGLNAIQFHPDDFSLKKSASERPVSVDVTPKAASIRDAAPQVLGGVASAYHRVHEEMPQQVNTSVQEEAAALMDQANPRADNRGSSASIVPASTNFSTIAPSATPSSATISSGLIAQHQQLDVPVGHTAWEQSMAKQVLQAGQNQQQSLQIRLNPSNLGLLDVQIAVDADNTSIVFSSQHAVVREAVEAAIPRLREMFTTSGMNLGDVDVAHHGAPEDQGRQAPDQQFPGGREGMTDVADVSDAGQGAVEKNSATSSGEQLLDYYI